MSSIPGDHRGFTDDDDDGTDVGVAPTAPTPFSFPDDEDASGGLFDALRPATVGLMQSNGVHNDGDASEYLAAISGIVASMPPERLKASLDYVLFPLNQVIRRETTLPSPPDGGNNQEAMTASAQAAYQAPTHAAIAAPPTAAITPKQQAAKRRVLEEAVKCVGSVVARSGGCGSAEQAMDLFCNVVAARGPICFFFPA